MYSSDLFINQISLANYWAKTVHFPNGSLNFCSVVVLSQEEASSEADVVMKDLRPRLCHMTLGEQGFGFNLHCKKSRVGQFIRSVDPDSPAEHAGLRPKDRLIEVIGRDYMGPD